MGLRNIYTLNLREGLGSSDFFKVLSCLPEEKRIKIKRFVRKEDAQRALAAELLIRQVIKNELQLNGQNIKLGNNKYGKPFLLNNKDFHFNVSHSGAWVVCATGSSPVGIDIELIKPIDSNVAKLVKFTFSEEEYQLFQRDKSHCFFDLWTLKESYIKAVGLGLSIPLNSFTINFVRDHNISIKVGDKVLKSCFLRQYNIDKGYKIAACSFENEFPESVTMLDLKQCIKTNI